jgi:hypothetical protein
MVLDERFYLKLLFAHSSWRRAMRLQPRTSPETDRCMDLIQQLASVVVQDLCVDAGFQSVTLTGRAGSWYAKQVATTAARRMYPNHRIENLLQVVTPR